MAHDLSTKGELTWIIKTDHRLEINPKELALKNSIHTVADFFFPEEIIFCSADYSGKPRRKTKQDHCYLTAKLHASQGDPDVGLQTRNHHLAGRS